VVDWGLPSGGVRIDARRTGASGGAQRQADRHRLQHGIDRRLAVNGTSGLLAMQIWADDTNKKGGLLGRPVKLDYNVDQINPSLVPGALSSAPALEFYWREGDNHFTLAGRGGPLL
jgi:hypothetical protein